MRKFGYALLTIAAFPNERGCLVQAVGLVGFTIVDESFAVYFFDD